MVGGAIYVTGSGFNCGTVEMNEGAKIINNYGGYMSAIAGSAGAHITINGVSSPATRQRTPARPSRTAAPPLA